MDLGPYRGPQRGIEGGEGLVEEDDLGAGRQGAGQGDPLLLPAGELVGVAAGQAGQADQFQQLVHPGAPAIRPGQPEGHVAPDAEVREEGALLGHIADPAPLAGHEPVPGVVHHL